MLWSRGVRGPLTNVRVVEFGQLIAGPLVGTLLGDFGAEVIKVEPPAGDQMRDWGQVRHRGRTLWWSVLARNKRSVALDLKDPEAAGARAGAGRRRRRGGRELPPRRDGALGAGTGGRARGQPGLHLRARERLRAALALPRPPRLRLRRRGDLGAALHQRLPRTGAAPRGHLARRLAGGVERLPGDPARAVRARHPGRGRAGGRRGDPRRLLRDDRVARSRLRPRGRRARAERVATAPDRAVERVPLIRRPLGGDRRQPRPAVAQAGRGDGPSRAGRGSALRDPRRPRRAPGRARRADRRVGGRAHRRRARRAARRRQASCAPPSTARRTSSPTPTSASGG